jgi:hypothetical protein
VSGGQTHHQLKRGWSRPCGSVTKIKFCPSTGCREMCPFPCVSSTSTALPAETWRTCPSLVSNSTMPLATLRVLVPAGYANPLREHPLECEQSEFATRNSALKVGTGLHWEREELSSWEYQHHRNGTRRPVWRKCANTSQPPPTMGKSLAYPISLTFYDPCGELEGRRAFVWNWDTCIWHPTCVFQIARETQVPQPPRALSPPGESCVGLFLIGTASTVPRRQEMAF